MHSHSPLTPNPSPLLRRLAGLSILAAVVTIGMKAVAYRLTGSVGLFADALESGINLLAAATAYFTLWYSARPADPTHAFGHEKIEYFSSGLEGMLVGVAGAGTVWAACGRLVSPSPLERIGLGVAIAVAASAVNLVVGLLLLRVGRRQGSIVLEADGHHLMTDVWTTAAVAVGLVLVAVTGLTQLDAWLALAVGLHILVVGFRLVRRSFDGLMDHALPTDEQAALREAIRTAVPAGTDFHLLRTRQAGRRKFVDFHLLVNGGLSVRDAHALAHDVEGRLRESVPGVEVGIHVEPIDERSSWEAAELRQLGEPVAPAADD
jgi:cation diffusion facilitator family transporter